MSWAMLAKQLAIPVAEAMGKVLIRWIKGETRIKITDMLEEQRPLLKDAIKQAESEGNERKAKKLSKRLEAINQKLGYQ